MIVKMTSKNQVTFSKEVCLSLGLKKGSRIEIFRKKRDSDWRLRPLRIQEEKLGLLHDEIIKKGTSKKPFDIHRFRAERKNYAKLRN